MNHDPTPRATGESGRSVVHYMLHLNPSRDETVDLPRRGKRTQWQNTAYASTGMTSVKEHLTCSMTALLAKIFARSFLSATCSSDPSISPPPKHLEMTSLFCSVAINRGSRGTAGSDIFKSDHGIGVALHRRRARTQCTEEVVDQAMSRKLWYVCTASLR
ncbi:hypothetical protein PoB_000284500 [Plakobranchus ocellatus]|uniref:Uncharacterized protein n=1 Tax=Plakobranchus ocellatus TaxID=259542 RepID=A0AAV3XZT2_9GAST|nr:hypothetical protein PoB_000284500 [Plakobranchus ocellatus]